MRGRHAPVTFGIPLSLRPVGTMTFPVRGRMGGEMRVFGGKAGRDQMSKC
jgi:hypothetical protein